MVAFIRFAALAAIGLSYLGIRLRRKKQHSNQTIEEDLSRYEKNQEGLYPWEQDQNDSPNRIEKNAARYVNQARPRRGRW
ncbi:MULTISPECIES: hypothetical protein [unclassified Enterococcus]|uniref:hypothetical protein n=1 Tax=unclassified Enterococcus TaxID=2608891 RepID=UPI0013E9B3F2|nr:MULTISPECIES: hypothetical protein [unclassified Enterococcus]